MPHKYMTDQSIAQHVANLEGVLLEEAPGSKLPASLGKLNRFTRKAKASIRHNGHIVANFKRDYLNGVSSYVCTDCGAGAVVIAREGINQSTVEGEALSIVCSGPKS